MLEVPHAPSSACSSNTLVKESETFEKTKLLQWCIRAWGAAPLALLAGSVLSVANFASNVQNKLFPSTPLLERRKYAELSGGTAKLLSLTALQILGLYSAFKIQSENRTLK